MNELTLRIMTASVLFAGAVYWLFYLPAAWFNIVLGLVAVAATVELTQMLQMTQRRLYNLIAVLAWALLLVNEHALQILPLAWVVLMVGWLFLLIFNAQEGELETAFKKIAYAQWMMTWLMLFVLALMLLHTQEDGVVFIAGACMGVWASDVAAYFTGKAWGKDKLSPVVSPGKTWQGLMGGVVAGVMTAMFIWLLFMDMTWYVALLLSLVLVLCGVLGDLAESVLKRAVGVKDSGTMLPGHGGLLDRIDALLPAIPAAGFLWIIFG